MVTKILQIFFLSIGGVLGAWFILWLTYNALMQLGFTDAQSFFVIGTALIPTILISIHKIIEKDYD